MTTVLLLLKTGGLARLNAVFKALGSVAVPYEYNAGHIKFWKLPLFASVLYAGSTNGRIESGVPWAPSAIVTTLEFAELGDVLADFEVLEDPQAASTAPPRVTVAAMINTFLV
ncbi:hypothetical protein AB6A68_10710 [Ferrimicrobium acidiphilum]|uniref:Uncharacterized protein n=1 Tax=Ferrimicrobium acidiphilum TaxID=121039 RepID=A0ABV3Y415_9ACTN